MSSPFTQTMVRAVVGTVGTTVAALTCLAGATAPAHAAELGAPRSQAVRFADLNLASSEGRAVLDRRIRNAANAVCTATTGGLAARLHEARCVRTAIDRALPQIVAARDGKLRG